MAETKNRAGPGRTCVGCGRRDDARALVRLVRGEGAEIAVDAAGGAFGRGAHVHPTAPCVAKAARGGLARAFKQGIQADPAALAASIADALERRMAGLILSARRTKAVEIGADAACEALEKGAPLVVVARDAGTVVQRGPVARAIAEGRAVAWQDKATLGALLGRDEVAVLALWSGPIAEELRRARAMALGVAGNGGSSEWCREVR